MSTAIGTGCSRPFGNMRARSWPRAETRTPCARGIAITFSRWRRRLNPSCGVRSRPSGCGAWRRSTRTCALRSSGASWLRRRAALFGSAGRCNTSGGCVDTCSRAGSGARGAWHKQEAKRQHGIARTRSARREGLPTFRATIPRPRRCISRAWRSARELGDQRGIATSLSNLGVLAASQGDYAAARTLFEESLAILRQLDDPWGIAIALGNLGSVASEAGDLGCQVAPRRELGHQAEAGQSVGSCQVPGELG